MKTRLKFVVAFCAAFVLQAGAEGADYFVNKQGNDANDGASRATSFLTIQTGVDALKPGDTLTIGPGEYFENVQRSESRQPGRRYRHPGRDSRHGGAARRCSRA